MGCEGYCKGYQRVKNRVLGVLHRVLGVQHRVLEVMHRRQGGLHRVNTEEHNPALLLYNDVPLRRFSTERQTAQKHA